MAGFGFDDLYCSCAMAGSGRKSKGKYWKICSCFLGGVGSQDVITSKR